MKIDQTPPLPRSPRPVVSIGTGSIVEVGHWPAYKLAGFPVYGAYDLSYARALELSQTFGVSRGLQNFG